MPAQNNPFKAFLNEVPEAAYFSHRDSARSPAQRRHFDTQFQAVQNKYMGELGRMFSTGQGDPGSFAESDYYDRYFAPGGQAETDWMQNPGRRAGASRFSPPIRFNYQQQSQNSNPFAGFS